MFLLFSHVGECSHDITFPPSVALLVPSPFKRCFSESSLSLLLNMFRTWWKNVDSLIQAKFMSIVTFYVALNAWSASILTLLKGAKIALECRTFKPDAAHCIREAPKSCREFKNSSGSSSKIPDAEGDSKIRMAHLPPFCHSLCVRERIVCYKSLKFL